MPSCDSSQWLLFYLAEITYQTGDKHHEADIWTKHRIDKELVLADNIPSTQGLPLGGFFTSILHLIMNAAAMSDNTPVEWLTIRSAFHSRHVAVEFIGSGAWMMPVVMEKIFDPFFSTKASNPAEAGDGPLGTGLGLYSCAEIIKAFGGGIVVNSQSGQ